jgi:hypothetical protein
MAEHFGVALVPNTTLPFEAGPAAHDIIAQHQHQHQHQHQRDAWQLESSRVDQYGAEVIVFRRPT